MRFRFSIVVIVLGLAAIVAASVLSMHPSLSDARDALEREWGGLQPALDQRYDRLAELSRSVGDARPDEPALLRGVDDAVSEWKTAVSERPTPDVEGEVPAANRVESAGARLMAAVLASPRLVDDRAVVEALRGFVSSDPTVERAQYNDAVGRYDSARARFPGRFFADLLGFDGLATVELPIALVDLDLPELPAGPAPTPEPESADTEADDSTPANQPDDQRAEQEADQQAGA